MDRKQLNNRYRAGAVIPGRKDKKMTAKEIIDTGLFETAVNMMDDEIREELHRELAPCSEVEFLEAYMERHEQKYNEEFEI